MIPAGVSEATDLNVILPRLWLLRLAYGLRTEANLPRPSHPAVALRSRFPLGQLVDDVPGPSGATAILCPSFHSYLLDGHKFARRRRSGDVIWVEIRYLRKTKKRRRLENSKWLMTVLAQ